MKCTIVELQIYVEYFKFRTLKTCNFIFLQNPNSCNLHFKLIFFLDLNAVHYFQYSLKEIFKVKQNQELNSLKLYFN